MSSYFSSPLRAPLAKSSSVGIEELKQRVQTRSTAIGTRRHRGDSESPQDSASRSASRSRSGAEYSASASASARSRSPSRSSRSRSASQTPTDSPTLGATRDRTSTTPSVRLPASVDASYDYLLKTLLIGDSCTGKSSLLRQFTSERPITPSEFISHPYSTTIGLDFGVQLLECPDNGKRIKFQIWDSAGQEKFKTITRQFYRGAHAILLVFDLTDIHSFYSLNQWIHEIDQQLGYTSTDTAANGTASIHPVPIVLLGNKCDLSSKRVINAIEINKFIHDIQLKYPILCSEMEYLEVSALKNHNVEEIFICAAKLVERVEAMKEKDQVHDGNNGNNGVNGTNGSGLLRFGRSNCKEEGDSLKECCSIM